MSRVSTRQSTKAKARKHYQSVTSGTIARARRPHKGTGKRDFLARLSAPQADAILDAAYEYAQSGLLPQAVQ